MLYLSPTLCTAHFYKEDFLRILDCKDRDSAKAALSEWINCAFDCGIERFKKCAQTMINWMSGILNSFSTPVTNGFTEGCNNKIKVLKRIAFGYKNFHRSTTLFRVARFVFCFMISLLICFDKTVFHQTNVHHVGLR